MGVFNGWFSTDWYRMLYRDRDAEDAAALVMPIIRKLGLAPGMRLLDMACGRGRHAAIFAREGLRVTGIDLSTASIADAQRNVPDAHFEVHDMRVPIAHNHYDAAVCLFNSLGYTNDREDDARTVAAACEALKEKGAFVLDLLNGPLAAAELVSHERVKRGEVQFLIHRERIGDELVKHIAVHGPHGVEEYEERVHMWTEGEVRALLTSNGFTTLELTDGTAEAPFRPDRSEQLIVWARKP